MLRSLVSASLKQRYVVLIGAAALMVVGVYAALRSPLDVFPEFAPPLVEVQTEAPGMPTESVESLITSRLESALNGLPRMTTLRSKSVQGLSSIQMFFERGTDLFQARQMVTERVEVAAKELPHQADGQPLTPRVMPPLSSTARVLHIGLSPKRPEDLKPGEKPMSQTDISVLMKWTIGPRLLAVPGVANVSTYGLHDKQFQIFVRPRDLRDFGVNLEQVKLAVKKAIVNGSAAYHVTPNQQLGVQYLTPVDKAEDLGDIVIDNRNGVPITLRQIATLTTGNPLHIGEGVVNDEAGLFVVVEKFPWANTLQVTRDVEKVMKKLEPGMPGVAVTTRIFRPATFIEQALGNLRTAMIIGSILVALILLAFLFEWRTAAISLTAIPLSLISAVLVMVQFGMTINTMVLAGLAIAIGEVVDDAIIDVENIVRRLQQNRHEGNPRSAFAVILDASLEVRSAVVYASFIVVFVCLPIFFLGGVAGSFFRPLAIAYILAVMASLIVALVVTPALCYLLLPQAIAKEEPAPLVRWVRSFYQRLLPPILNRPFAVLATLVILLGIAVGIYPRLKEEYLPHFQETDFVMHWVAKPGTSIDVLRQDIIALSKEMRSEKAVAEFGSHIARAELGEEVVGPNFSELWVSLGEDFSGNYQEARKKIEAIMARHPGFQHDLESYLHERIKEVLSGASATVVLRIYGPELYGLRERAQEVYQAIQGVPGVADLKIEPQVLVPQLKISTYPYLAATYGLTPEAIQKAVFALINGARVASIHQDQRVYDVVLWGHPDIRRNESDLKRLEIDLPTGQGTVPLAAVADIRRVSAPNTIRHDKASRCIDVTCNIKDRDLGSAVGDIEKKLQSLPQNHADGRTRWEGYRVEALGEYQARSENQRQLLGVSILALLGIAILLFFDFQSFRLTLLVMLTLPFALIGGVAAAFAAGGVLSLGSLVGFITVLGIAARNGIMLVSHYRHLEKEEGMPFGRELILRGARERVAPILMTALAAGLGLLPLALSGSKPGYEVEFPMAIVILGGLFTSTLLNLLVLPVLYERFGRTTTPTN